MSMIASIESVMLEGERMSEPAGKTLTEDQVLLIAKALGDRRRYEIVKRLGERPDALACGAVCDCMGINPATLSHHMKELEIAGLVEVVREANTPAMSCGAPCLRRSSNA
jgi:ArsR family transcriptional regulator, arsenate/arsenite/antimonite-responsive transcriptional repressor